MSIGRYNVDLHCLDTIGVTAISDALAHKRLVIIDEFGSMEALSASFRQGVLEALDSTVPLIGIIVLRSHSWLDTIKQHPRVQLLTLTTSERKAAYQHKLSFAQTVLAEER